MSDPKFPTPPNLPTFALPRDTLPDTTPPNDDDPFALMAELKAALANAGDLMTRLTTRLSRVQLALLANEHAARTASATAERAEELAKRVAEYVGMAAE